MPTIVGSVRELVQQPLLAAQLAVPEELRELESAMLRGCICFNGELLFTCGNKNVPRSLDGLNSFRLWFV
jgi:hypothetical protein